MSEENFVFTLGQFAVTRGISVTSHTTCPKSDENPESPLVDLVTYAVLDNLLRSQVGYFWHLPVISFGAETETKQDQLTPFTWADGFRTPVGYMLL